MIELIYPHEFKMPGELHTYIYDYEMKNYLIDPADILKACRYVGKVFITFSDKQTHKYAYDYRNKIAMKHIGPIR